MPKVKVTVSNSRTNFVSAINHKNLLQDLVPVPKVNSQGLKDKLCLQLIKTTIANWTKLHRKAKSDLKIRIVRDLFPISKVKDPNLNCDFTITQKLP